MIASVLMAIALMSSACLRSVRQENDVSGVRDDRNPVLLLARGKAALGVGDTTRAEQYFVSALDAKASEQEVLPLLLRVCVQAKRYRVALDYIEPFLQRHPDNVPIRFVVASLYAAIGETVLACQQLDKLLAQAPNHAEAHFALASLLSREDASSSKAREHYLAYLRLHPKGAHALEARVALKQMSP